jgi:hypothetical protein
VSPSEGCIIERGEWGQGAVEVHHHVETSAHRRASSGNCPELSKFRKVAHSLTQMIKPATCSRRCHTHCTTPALVHGEPFDVSFPDATLLYRKNKTCINPNPSSSIHQVRLVSTHKHPTFLSSSPFVSKVSLHPLHCPPPLSASPV